MKNKVAILGMNLHRMKEMMPKIHGEALVGGNGNTGQILSSSTCLANRTCDCTGSFILPKEGNSLGTGNNMGVGSERINKIIIIIQ